jgi:hypothetical protein
MSSKGSTRSFLAGWLCLSLALVPMASHAAPCPGITHSNWTSPSWEYDEFFDADTGLPYVVALAVSEIANTTIVEVKSEGTWVRVTTAGTYTGVATRFSLGGSVQIAYSDGECGEEIQPHH